MRILAVITACEGSELLPNKNMRLINGKPMIYYVINNAKKSKYITEVIVTTNSNEIISISKQMKVMTHLRSRTLCNCSVSVDEVVFDVFKVLNIDDYDYVVTMQSISPALNVESLDDAIEKIVQKQCDTVISVTNRSHFYWEIKYNEAHPVQSERKNRHQLPAFYMETGGFFVSTSENIKHGRRIGDKVELYELNDDEAIDVYTFGDLKQVESIMSRSLTAFYVNGNSEIGLGHISRVLQIADELFSKPDIYFDENQTDIGTFGETCHNLISVNGESDFLSHVSQKNYDTVINDILSTDMEYMKQLRKIVPRAKIVNFEDDGEGASYADVVINALYESKSTNKFKNGYRYYILPKSFLVYEPIKIHKFVKNIVATFGGADPQGYTDKLLEIAVREKYRGLHFYVIIGVAKYNANQLKKYEQYDNITILYNIDYMAEIMNKADLAITSRGRTCYELASLGVPTISIAQNKRELKHKYICADNGFFCLGINATKDEIQKKIDDFLNMPYENKIDIQKLLLKNDLRNGRARVIELLNG